MPHTHRICVIALYMGKLPWYYSYFLDSCTYNPTVDFFLILDDRTPQPLLPPNVSIIYKTLAEINQTATEKLGIRTNVQNGYKLCDFKPAYAVLFPELVEGYDFWAQTDIDVIFGDIRHFLDDAMLAMYDYISTRHDWTAGCFSVFRNTTFVNELFKRSKDYEKVITDSKNYCFDECSTAYDHLMQGGSIFDMPTEVESYTHLVKKAQLAGELNAHFDFIILEGVPGEITFNTGKIIFRNRFEGMLYHLYWLKRVYTPDSVPEHIPSVYYFSKTEICFESLTL